MNPRPWRTSQGGEGVLPGAASVPSPNAANYKRNETENGWPNRHPCKWGHVYLTPP